MISRYAISAIFKYNVKVPKEGLSEIAEILSYCEKAGKAIKKADAGNIGRENS